MDAAEGSGTNMMNINTHQWDRKLLEQCGGNSLYEKLNKEPVEGGTLLGNISHYYVERYGFHPGKFFFSICGWFENDVYIQKNLH